LQGRRKILSVAVPVLLLISLALGLSGCSATKTSETTGMAATTQSSQLSYGKTVVAYAGGTCEAPTFVALQKGFFKAEGLDVELVQMGFDDLKIGLTTGKVDAAQANFAWFKPIEQGMNVKLTAGIHTGCIKAVAPPASGIKTVADLKGKTVGVDAIGGGPMIALSIKLRQVGIDPQKDVQWRAYPGPQLDQAIAKGEIQAYMTWDPFPTMDANDNNYTTLLDIHNDDPFINVDCCFVGVNGDLVKNNPAKAAAITRALLKAADWVAQNPAAAAKIELDYKYVGGDLDLNTAMLASYKWDPSVKQAQNNVKFYITELKAQGILDKSTDSNVLYNTIFGPVIPDFNGK
jgi:NitT/TauT family transport system substrate-binding protein